MTRLLAAMPDRRFYHDLKHRDAVRKDGSSTRLRMYLYPELLARLPAEQKRSVDANRQGALLASSSNWRSSASSGVRSRSASASRPRRLASTRSRSCCATSRAISIRHPQRRREEGDDCPILPAARRIAAEYRHHFPREATRAKERGRTTQMPFMPASGYAFPVSLTKSWHSATTTSAGDGERVSMMVTYYVADSFARRLYWRARRALSVARNPLGSLSAEAGESGAPALVSRHAHRPRRRSCRHTSSRTSSPVARRAGSRGQRSWHQRARKRRLSSVRPEAGRDIGRSARRIAGSLSAAPGSAFRSPSIASPECRCARVDEPLSAAACPRAQ